MDLVSASLMLHKTENQVTEASIKRLYNAINATVNEDILSVFINRIENMNIDEVMEKTISYHKEFNITSCFYTSSIRIK